MQMVQLDSASADLSQRDKYAGGRWLLLVVRAVGSRPRSIPQGNAERLAVGFRVTPGQAFDVTAGCDLMAEDVAPPNVMLGENGYDSDVIRTDFERCSIDRCCRESLGFGGGLLVGQSAVALTTVCWTTSRSARRNSALLTDSHAPTHSRNRRHSRGCRVWRRADQAERHCPKVLHGGGEMELVAGTGEAAKPHALEAVVGLQVPEAHLDPLALVA